jgi:hypothetical protein
MGYFYLSILPFSSLFYWGFLLIFFRDFFPKSHFHFLYGFGNKGKNGEPLACARSGAGWPPAGPSGTSS